MLATAGLSGFAVVMRDDSAELLFPFNFTFSRGYEINIQNLVIDFLALVRPGEVVMRQPLSVNVFKVINAQADKVVKALRFNGRNIAFRESVCLGGARRSFHDLRIRTFPEGIEAGRKLSIAISDQMACFNSNILHPHGSISCLLKHPFFIGMKRCWTHVNTSASEMNKHQNESINFSLPGHDRLGEKIDSDQGFNVRGNESRPGAVRVFEGLVRNRIDRSRVQTKKPAAMNAVGLIF